MQLLHETLLRRGFKASEITLISDALAGAMPPTRKNILETLGKLAANANPGDFFFVHMSGHGSQQPVDPKRASARPEPDGLHETFLPIDIGRWDGARATVANAIIDYELDEIVQALLDRGAFVWLSFDACHAASLVRGASKDEVTLRHVAPSVLGVPPELIEQAQPQTRGTDGETPLDEGAAANSASGAFVAFYAAQTNEDAPEMLMPAGRFSPGTERKRHGVFSYTLAEALNARAGATYRELMQFILSRYATQILAHKPTPVLSGNGIDKVALGATTHAGPRQWPVTEVDGAWRIPAGQLAQIGAGSLFSIVADPLAADERRIATAVVKRVSPFAAEMAPVLGERGERPGKLPPGAYARLQRPAVAMRLRVAEPPSATGEVARLLRDVRGATGQRIDWVSAGEPADMRLHVEDAQLWLLPATGSLQKSGTKKTPSLALAREGEKLAGLLSDSLQRMAKALNLMRVAEQMPDTGDAALAVSFSRLANAPGQAAKPLSISNIERVTDGTKIAFSIANRSKTPFDVTLLYLDSAFGITPLFPGAGEDNRVMPGSVLRAGDGGLAPIEINAETLGVERLLVIATAVEPQGERSDFSYLAQPRLDGTRGAQAPDSILQDLLEQAAFDATARGAGKSQRGQALMRVIAWEVTKH